MKKLHTAGLQGARLVEVRSKRIVRRYNACLKLMGIEPTKLTRFSVDKIGWSPEIAEEKGDNVYLSHGATVLGIIVSIEQEGASLHHPFYSFDRHLLDKVYREQAKALRDITTSSGVCLEIDSGITEVRTPEDLLMIHSFEVHTTTPRKLVEAAAWQKHAAVLLKAEGEAWADRGFRAQIIRSARKFGDLRLRNFDLHTIFYDEVECFFSHAFDGVFVFRDEPTTAGGQASLPLVICVEYPAAVSHGNAYAIHDDALRYILPERGIVAVGREMTPERIHALARYKEDWEVRTLGNAYPHFDFVSQTSAHRKGHVVKHRDLFPEEYFELGRFIALLERGTIPELSPALEKRLWVPPPSGSLVRDETVEVLLSFLDPTDLVRLYRWNKKQFYREYKKWPPSLQRWAIHRILRDYKGVDHV